MDGSVMFGVDGSGTDGSESLYILGVSVRGGKKVVQRRNYWWLLRLRGGRIRCNIFHHLKSKIFILLYFL